MKTKRQTQLDWIKKRLLKYGVVTRNQALNRMITRLGARIIDLKKEGWIFSAGYLKTKYGKDYAYSVLREG